MADILIIGYGNPDRQDDGVAWHVLNGLTRELGSQIEDDTGDAQLRSGTLADLLFELQLTPETAELLAKYAYACFVDAHTGAVKNDLNIAPVSADYQASPFTHHMTPQTCLSIAANLYHSNLKDAQLVSIRGYGFEFSRDLTPKTAALGDAAVQSILGWIRAKSSLDQE